MQREIYPVYYTKVTGLNCLILENFIFVIPTYTKISATLPLKLSLYQNKEIVGLCLKKILVQIASQLELYNSTYSQISTDYSLDSLILVVNIQ